MDLSSQMCPSTAHQQYRLRMYDSLGAVVEGKLVVCLLEVNAVVYSSLPIGEFFTVSIAEAFTNIHDYSFVVVAVLVKTHSLITLSTP